MTPTGGRSSDEIPIAAPDWDRSMTRQATLVPFGKTNRANALRGAKRPWRRSSGKLRICRFASQVSCAASLSRFRNVAEMRHRKAVFEGSRNFALEPAQMVDVGDDAFARLARDRCIERHASRRHVDHLTRIFPPIRQHVAAEKVNLHALMPPAFLSQRQDHRFGLWQCHRCRDRKVFSAIIEPRSLSLTLR